MASSSLDHRASDVDAPEADENIDQIGDSKRPRLDQARSWDDSVFIDWANKEDSFHFDPQQGEDDTNLYAEIERVLARLDGALASWETVSPDGQWLGALKLLAVYLDSSFNWDPKSDLLLARTIAVLSDGKLRAHSDDVRYYLNGAHRRTKRVPATVVTSLEDSFSRARFLCRHLADAQVPRDWGEVFTFFEYFTEWGEFTPVEDYEFTKKHWAAVASSIFKAIPWRASSTSSNAALACFATWFMTPYPELSDCVNTEDGCLKIEFSKNSSPRIKQVEKSPENNCYLHINTCLSWKPCDSDVERYDRAISQAWAKNPEGRIVHDFNEILGLLGRCNNRSIVLLRGNGMNSKSVLAALRNNVAGSNHAFVSASVFEVQEEFRKQGGQFARCNLITISECTPGMKILDIILKPFASGEPIACRPLYGRTTEYHDWYGSAVFWEINRETFRLLVSNPELPEALLAWVSRFLVCDLYSEFTSDPLQVDHEALRFASDPLIKDFMSSPVAVWCRIRRNILPLLEQYAPEEMLEKLTNPSEEMKKKTMQVVQQMVSGGLEIATEEGRREKECFEQAKELLMKVFTSEPVDHCKDSFVKSYRIRNHPSIPGSQKIKGSEKKPAKIDNFREAIGIYPFLFREETGRDGFVKLNIDLVKFRSLSAQYGPGIIGNIEDYPLVWDEKVLPRELSEEWEEFTRAVSGHLHAALGEGDEEAGVVVEIINLSALQTLVEEGSDRRHANLKQYVQKLVRDSYKDPEWPGMVCHKVFYIRKYGIGRRYAVGWSLQVMTKEARAVACQGPQVKAVDVDIQNAMPSMAAIYAKKYGWEDNLKTMIHIVTHVKHFREFMEKLENKPSDEVKLMFLMLFFFGRAPNDNPILWSLSRDVRMFAAKLLGHKDFMFLNQMFQNRKNPVSSRLFYALSMLEDTCVETLRQALVDQAGGHISCLLFDGVIMHFPFPEGEDERNEPNDLPPSLQQGLDTVLASLHESEGFKAIVKPW